MFVYRIASPFLAVDCFLVMDDRVQRIIKFFRFLTSRTFISFFHYSSCLCIMGMAIERYIQICRPLEADTILSRKNRMIAYSVITFVALFLPSILLLNDIQLHYFGSFLVHRTIQSPDAQFKEFSLNKQKN